MSETTEPAATPPASKSRMLPIIVILAAAVGIGAGYYYLSDGKRSRVFERDGHVTFLDPVTRRAAMELPDAKGGIMDMPVDRVPDDCKITIDGKPATLADIRLGDPVHVTVRLTKWKSEDGERHKEFVPLAVDARRGEP